MSAQSPADHDQERSPAVLDDVRRRAAFLARISPFRDLDREERERVARAVEERTLGPGMAVLVEGGPPGTVLYVVVDGILELTTRGQVIDVVTSGGLAGIPTLLTGLAPEITVRARDHTVVYEIPRDVALSVLGTPEGVGLAARVLRDRFLRATRMTQPVAETTSAPVSAIIRRAPVICGPDTPIREAARIMSQEVVSAILVETRDGLGIVSNADLRDKVVAGGASPDAPVSSIMTTPVLTIRGERLASEASIEMMRAGVNHLVVVDAHDRVLGVLSSASLMSPDALSPIALRWSIMAAHSVDEVVAAAELMPGVFVSLVDARLDAAAISRVITIHHDALTQRLLQLGIARHGPPPVPYAWLALGSGGRGELTLSSDQDNALAYADSDDPTVDEYFARLAADVNDGLARCGFERDQSGVMACDPHWRMSLSAWVEVFTATYQVWDLKQTLRASVSFDFRKVAGDLDATSPLVEVLLIVRDHPSLLNRIARTVTDIRSPLGFRQRLTGPIDVKKSALLPIENIARYYALANRVTAASTLDRLAAVRELGGLGSSTAAQLPDAYRAVWHLRLRHHANAIRAGRPPDDAVDSTKLRPLTYAELQEALRIIAWAQKRVPQVIMPGDLERRA
jgi:CBS domain-containing protein